MFKDGNSGFYDFAEHPYCSLNQNPNRRGDDAIEEAIYSSDEFRMYAYKIRRCTRTRSHDWTDCPFAHRGEKAQRRDPRRMPYCAIACPAFRNGRCYKGDSCEFAHGVFEYWLHPSRYRTRACTAGRFCQRKVCFFAHTPEQLRAEGKTRCHFADRGRMNGGDHRHDHHHHHHQNHQQFTMGLSTANGDQFARSAIMMVPQLSPLPSLPSNVNKRSSSENVFDGVSEFLKSMTAMKIRDDKNVEAAANKAKNGVVGFQISDADLPNIEWISDLVQ